MTLLADIIWSRVGFGVLLVVGLAFLAGMAAIGIARMIDEIDEEDRDAE